MIAPHPAGGGGGRRDAEKSGRARVMESEVDGNLRQGIARKEGVADLDFQRGQLRLGGRAGLIRGAPPAKSWPRAMHAEKVVIAAIAQAQRPIIFLLPLFRLRWGVSPRR